MKMPLRDPSLWIGLEEHGKDHLVPLVNRDSIMTAIHLIDSVPKVLRNHSQARGCTNI